MPSLQRNTNRLYDTIRRMSKKRFALLITLSVVVIVFGIVGGIVISAIASCPPFDPKQLTQTDQTSFVYDKNGGQIGTLHLKEDRESVEANQIPDIIKKSFVGVEDVRFYDHHGVDPIGIARALVHTITGGQREGGSTITVQLARGAFLSPDQKIRRKIQEAYLAMRIERSYTKEEILTFYLNRIFFGEGSYGIKTAAKTYFGKDITSKKPDDQLTVAEAAMLAGLPQAPSSYDPYNSEEKAKNRRTIVLGMLKANKIITQAEYDKAKDEKFTYVDRLKSENKSPQSVNNRNGANISYQHPWFVEYTIEELKNEKISQDAIFSGGLKIYTTMDPVVQDAAETAFSNPANFPNDVGKGEQAQQVQGAMVVISPKDGSIAAMVGGREHKEARQLNRAWQSLRQPGSSAKPLVVYAPALEKTGGGYYEGTVLDDMPVSYPWADGKEWKPQDSDTESSGWMGLITMRKAVQESVNVYAIKLLKEIGIKYGFDFAKNQFGLPLDEKANMNLSLALGTESVHVIDMAAAFTAFPSGGKISKKHSILKVVDAKGTVLIDNSNVERNQAINEQTAYLMNDMLTNVVQNGTARNAKIPGWAVAGKTGTTSLNDNARNAGMRDIWFVGYTPEYVGAVWMGLDVQGDTPLRGQYGGNKPALLWKQVMTKALEGKPKIDQFPKPATGITKFTFDRKSGKAPSELTPKEFIDSAWAISGNLPSGRSNVWQQIEVCKEDGLLPGPGTRETEKRVFLNVDRKGIKERWPGDESRYQPPTQTCTNTHLGSLFPFPGAPKQDVKDLDKLNFMIDAQGIVMISVDIGKPCVLQAQLTGPLGYYQQLPPQEVADPVPGFPLKGPSTPLTVKGKYTVKVIALEPGTNKQLASLSATAEFK